MGCYSKQEKEGYEKRVDQERLSPIASRQSGHLAQSILSETKSLSVPGPFALFDHQLAFSLINNQYRTKKECAVPACHFEAERQNTDYDEL